jgi:tellurite resistance-related uncharacterized protein
MNNILPEGLIAYTRTPTFDQDSLPAGLRRELRMKEGVWALIHAIEGRLRYCILDPPKEVLTPEAAVVVRPVQAHEVAPIGRMRPVSP